ncbi:MAG: alkaline phosphatase family protein [Bdellovibrionales bacterium]|nr:alkaline phosphatase family protein [Bdellovibrionales bacterium]
MFPKKIMLLLWGPVFFGACQTSTPPESGQRNRLPGTVVIAIDGVGFATFQKARSSGVFSQFRSPARMLSMFPTVSDPNWNSIFDLPPSLGFTKNTFDPIAKEGKGAVVGSLLSHLTNHPEYEKRFDHHKISIVDSATNLAWLETSLEVWLKDLPLRVLESRGRNVFFAFTLNVDLISHTQGEEAVLKWLQRIHESTAELESLYKKRGAPRPEIILVSDHGNSYYRAVDLINVVSFLELRGWKREDSLENEKSFVFVAPEILSVAGFWTKQNKMFAADVAETPGVLFSVRKASPTQLEIHSSLFGKKTIVVQKGSVLRNRDLATLELESELNQQRLWEAFELAATAPPTVIAVSKRGSAFSNPILKVITKMKGLQSLHGALYDSEAEGIFVSNKQDLPEIRPWEFKNFVDLKEFRTDR